MVNFLSKFQGSGVKIDRVNSIRVAKSLILFNILNVALLAKWRHDELSFSLCWACIYFSLVNILL